jgi:hypothetical protein
MLAREMRTRQPAPPRPTALRQSREAGVPVCRPKGSSWSTVRLARQTATCALLIATLNFPSTPKFATLPTAGRGGGAARWRPLRAPLQGKLVAKTGTISGVSGLAGYVSVKQPITISLLLNGRFGESTGTVAREEMAQAIGRYPDVPTADVLVPMPAAPIVP